MPKALALLVGLKNVDPAKYDGWDGANGCVGCELDVDNIDLILRPLGYDITTLKTAEATADNVLRTLSSAASKLDDGDIFVFYYSGHGSGTRDLNNDEEDGKDETLVTYDRQLVDDELDRVWLKFKSGVRLVMIADSCESGTNFRMVGRSFAIPTARPPVLISRAAGTQMKAQLIHLGGCRDDGVSAGYKDGGAFTMALCDLWKAGEFRGNYRQLLEQIKAVVQGTGQIPQYNEYGPVTDEFRRQVPFTVGGRVRVMMELTLTAPDIETAEEALRVHMGGCILDRLGGLNAARGCSASISGGASSGGGWHVGGGISCTF